MVCKYFTFCAHILLARFNCMDPKRCDASLKCILDVIMKMKIYLLMMSLFSSIGCKNDVCSIHYPSVCFSYCWGTWSTAIHYSVWNNCTLFNWMRQKEKSIVAGQSHGTKSQTWLAKGEVCISKYKHKAERVASK